MRELLIVLFGTETDEVVSAKLGLLSTSEDACLKYPDREIFSSFTKICKAACINGSELVSFLLKTLPTVRQSEVSSLCLCGKPNMMMNQWQRHNCKFEAWLRENRILYPKSPKVFGVERFINWTKVRKVGHNQPWRSTCSVSNYCTDFERYYTSFQWT
jgi:hypothetical protein